MAISAMTIHVEVQRDDRSTPAALWWIRIAGLQRADPCAAIVRAPFVAGQ